MPARVASLYQTACVTGASSGLGRAFAEMLLADGVRVWGTSREPSRLDSLAAGGGGAFASVELDLADGGRAETAFLAAEHAAGGFDLLINNAGYGVFGEFAETDFTTWDKQLQVMLVNTARLSHAGLRGMRARSSDGRNGAIVNVSSLAAEFPLPFQSAYNMAKAGLSALSESLMLEVAGTPVIVIDFRPGDYRTDFEVSVRHPQGEPAGRAARAWAAFATMMRGGPPPTHAAAMLRRALLRRRSGTVRTGRVFQAVFAPLLVRLAPLALKRRVQARYFDVP